MSIFNRYMTFLISRLSMFFVRGQKVLYMLMCYTNFFLLRYSWLKCHNQSFVYLSYRMIVLVVVFLDYFVIAALINFIFYFFLMGLGFFRHIFAYFLLICCLFRRLCLLSLVTISRTYLAPCVATRAPTSTLAAVTAQPRE